MTMNNPIITKQVEVNRFEFEHSLHFSIDLARIYFDEFINQDNVHFEHETYYKNALIVIGDLDSNYTAKSAYNKMKKSELIDLYNMINPNQYLDEDTLYTKVDIIDFVSHITKLDYVLAVREHLNSRDFYRESVDYAIRGYSQDDYCDVIELGTDSLYTRQDLHNLLYDAPVSGAIMIHDNLENKTYELYVDEYIKNTYEYDKDELIESITNCQYNKEQEYYNALIEWLGENLPEHLEHV